VTDRRTDRRTDTLLSQRPHSVAPVKKSKWQTAAILEIGQSLQRIIGQFLSNFVHNVKQQAKATIFKRWWTASILNIVNSPYFSDISTDLDEI